MNPSKKIGEEINFIPHKILTKEPTINYWTVLKPYRLQDEIKPIEIWRNVLEYGEKNILKIK